MDKRTLLAILLSIAVIFIYQAFFAKPPASDNQKSAQQKTVKSEPVDNRKETTIKEQVVPARNVVSTMESMKDRDIPVETPFYRAIFTTKGGALKSFKLKDYYRTLPPDRLYHYSDIIKYFRPESQTAVKGADLIELVDVKDNMPKPFSISFPDSNINIPLKDMYEANSDSLDLIKIPDKYRLTFSRTYPNDLKIEKIYTFQPKTYNIDLEVRVFNLSKNPVSENASLSWYQYVDPKVETDSYGHEGPITFIAKDINRLEVKKIDKDLSFGPDIAWGGFESKYFITALIPQNPSLTSLLITKDVNEMVTISLRGPKNLIPPGQASLFSYSLFLGPKDYNILKEQGVGLDNAIDFGSWLKWLAMPLLIILKFIYQYLHNYGIAIIILTCLIKLLFWPLGNMSYKSMKEMQKLQPKITELREKYKDDRTKIGQETMALYKSHKVNPLSGCLPMFIQIPVFFGLYRALLYSIELRHSPFFWWIQDLSAKDPYYITPIIMGGTMFIQQKMSPPMGDPIQAKLMLWMPVIFTFMFLNFPSGLVIYWLFNNIISIGQQYYINKRK